MHEVPPGAKGWLVIFHRRSRWWVEALCPGPWKHVSLVGFVPEAKAWIVLSWELGRMRTGILPDADFEGWIGGWAGEGAGVLRVAGPDFDLGPWRPRFGFFCTSMVCHVLGLRRGALWPDALWRILVRDGAEIASDGAEEVSPGRPFPSKNSTSPAVGAGTGAGRIGGARPA